ncbi:aldehyde dehydrogenase family protein [Mesorhizobium sp. M4A.F.Ca.ET.020.02.1.1]|uniref:aldehyde dehydrogenase family protein n=1 Tax=unclassified Mesorhizobium TaxID=325217 RepID=UPI000FD33757|nr:MULTISPECIES: aldehyde dehydrogenase family protein [unclassified Mesorhizobium]RVD38158.1 aldehyde dehydrogenase family protein [Mesorhizobium sp. M4A.F.Ca.ET.020.02.1.1]RWC17080.1 MAG: aldehyde dehydrogenase family protein [Mesorhizobium sp.]
MNVKAHSGASQILESLGISEVNPGFCSGRDGWSKADPDNAFASTNPATEQPIARITPATQEDMNKAIDVAERAYKTWRSVPAPKRGELVGRIGELLEKHKDALGALLSLETGKSLTEGKGEIGEMIDMAKFAVGQSRMLYGFTMQSQRNEHRMYDQWLPLGVVGIITAYNFPAAPWSWNAFIAAICGNTIVWKPSPKVALPAIALQHICNQAMNELGYEGIFSIVVPDDERISESLVSDKRVRVVSFTGSSKIGRRVSSILAEDLGRRHILECSGNNACIVDESAEFDLTIAAVTFGALGTTGQRCTSMRRLIVHKSRTKEIVEGLKKAYAKVKIGDPFVPGNLIGPLIDKHAIDEFTKAVASAKELGGEVVYGGNVLPGPGYYVEPTIIMAKNHWPCVQHETFAPLLYVIEYDTFEEAMELHNDVPQGLASGIQSTNIRNIEAFLSSRGSDCGIAKVNMGTTGADIGAAFGGEKETGGGRASGSESWKSYMRRQSVAINWGDETPWRKLLEG